MQELEQELEPQRVELEALAVQLQEQDEEMVEELDRTQVHCLFSLTVWQSHKRQRCVARAIVCETSQVPLQQEATPLNELGLHHPGAPFFTSAVPVLWACCTTSAHMTYSASAVRQQLCCCKCTKPHARISHVRPAR